MSFINNYSNVNAEVSLNTANLTATEINANDLSNVTITGGTESQVLTKGPFETLTWSTSPIVPIAAPGANTQVVYRSGTSNTFTASAGLTYDKTTNTLAIANAINSTAILDVTGYANLGPVSNMTIGGGSNGQVLISDGAGVLNWGSSPGSSITVRNYILDSEIVTSAAYSIGVTVLFLKVAIAKLQYVQPGRLIAFGTSGYGATYYTILSRVATQVSPSQYTVEITLTSAIQAAVAANTSCSVVENVPVNTIITNGGIVDTDVEDSVLTLFQNYGFTSPGQILLNNNASYSASSNVRYYETQAGIATANQQLVSAGDINTARITGVSGNLYVGSHTNNTTASINFSNSSSTGYLETGAGSTINLNANTVTVSGYTQAKAFTSKPYKFAHYTKTVIQGIARSVFPTDWYNVTWDNVISDNTGYTYSASTGSWTNNSGSNQRLLVTYQLAWVQGNPDAGMAKTTAIVVNDNIEYGVYGMSCNHNGPTDEPCFTSTFLIELNNGDNFRIKVCQNTEGSTQYIGLAGYNGQSVGGRLTFMILP